MKIYIANIYHKYGVNVLLSKTEEGRTEKVANFCRDYLDEVADYDRVKCPEDSDECIKWYFTYKDGFVEEWVDYIEAELED